MTQQSPGAPRQDNTQACLSEELLLDYVAGQCDTGEIADIDRHLDDCTDCQDWLEHWLRIQKPSQLPEIRASIRAPTTFTEGFVVNNRYRIQRFIGRGGMGEVYEAFDQLANSRVALKTLLCSRGDNRRALRRFREEVRNALRVGHRHVCRINELQEHQFRDQAESTVLFFTMEFVEGESLGQCLRERRLPLEDVRLLAHQLLQGLGAAHSQNILHLDFKCDNVLLRHETSSPCAVIMDFGLSRALDSHSSNETTERLQMAGTLPYMPVEQLESQPHLKPAADIYAFGVVLYEMLTGQLPFRAQTLSAMLLKQLRERPPLPGSERPGLAPGVDKFVMRCLELDPDKRFADAASAERALNRITVWRRQASRHRSRWLLGASALVCLILVAAVNFGASEPLETVRLQVRASPAEPQEISIPADPGSTRSPEFARGTGDASLTPSPLASPKATLSSPPTFKPKTRPVRARKKKAIQEKRDPEPLAPSPTAPANRFRPIRKKRRLYKPFELGREAGVKRLGFRRNARPEPVGSAGLKTGFKPHSRLGAKPNIPVDKAVTNTPNNGPAGHQHSARNP